MPKILLLCVEVVGGSVDIDLERRSVTDHKICWVIRVKEVLKIRGALRKLFVYSLGFILIFDFFLLFMMYI